MWNLTKLSRLLDKLVDNKLTEKEKKEVVNLWNFFFGSSVGSINNPNEIFDLTAEY